MTWFGNPLPEGAATETTLTELHTTTFESSSDTVATLEKILKELRLISAHLASMTGESITKDDVTSGE